MIRKGMLLFHILVTSFYSDLIGQVHIINLTNDYLAYYESSKDGSDDLKIENFHSMVYESAPLIYEQIFNDIKWIGQDPEDKILNNIDNFETIENKFKELSGSLDTGFYKALLIFQNEFNDFKPNFDVYIVHSLGIRAGGLVKIQDKMVLMFGTDQLARHFDFQNYIPFFHHELTHIYQSRYYTPVDSGKYSKDAIYNQLWLEGLAVYASSVLNPEAGQKEIFMRDSLSQKTVEVLDIISKDILENLYSTDKELIRKYFWESSTHPVIPKTAGYYFGYILVKEMAKNYSLNELILLKESDFLPEFEIIMKNINGS